MALNRSAAAKWAIWAMVCVLSLVAGCYIGLWGANEHSSAADSALGEEHELNYPAHDAFLLTQDALRGDGLLFEVESDNTLATLWRNADTKVGFMQNLLGVQPRYRYEIQVVPEGGRKSKIVVNLHTEGIPDNELEKYKASKRFALFGEIDELAVKYPPSSNTPTSGGVNFTVLPNEDLKALAQRVTGSADNWRRIAKDNGLSSPADVTPFQSVWVSNELLKKVPDKPSSKE
jgi:hypothetical protein